MLRQREVKQSAAHLIKSTHSPFCISALPWGNGNQKSATGACDKNRALQNDRK